MFGSKQINSLVVYISAKIRIFKQITTYFRYYRYCFELFISVQRYEFLSKSQLLILSLFLTNSCLYQCKDTNF